MKNKFLTVRVLKFLYQMTRIGKKRKAKPLVRKMTDGEWNDIAATCKELNIELK